MALAQPTPIAGTLTTKATGNQGLVTETILDVPGPVGSFAVVTLFLSNALSQTASLQILVGERIIFNFSYGLQVYSMLMKNEGLIIPGGEKLSVKYNNVTHNDGYVLTATGLFYKAS